MEIKISDEQMQSIVAGAVLQAMGTDARDTIMQGAITYLLTPQESRGYGSKPTTPLQSAFEQAASSYAQRAALEYLNENPHAREQIRAIFVAAYEKMVTEYAPDLIDKIARQMAEALTKDRY